jgi:hypothetical protein
MKMTVEPEFDMEHVTYSQITLCVCQEAIPNAGRRVGPSGGRQPPLSSDKIIEGGCRHVLVSHLSAWKTEEKHLY